MDRDRIRAIVAGFVDRVMARVDYHALYPCRVISQNADLTLELKPDVDKFGPGLSRVPLRLGLPGVSVKVKAQARVLLGFEGGDPQRPVATLWEADGLDEITITAQTKAIVNAPKVFLGDEDNAQPVACLGDTVEVLFPPGAIASGTVGGAPFTGPIVITDTLVGIIATTRATKTKAS
jgi:hypothetical protein